MKFQPSYSIQAKKKEAWSWRQFNTVFIFNSAVRLTPKNSVVGQLVEKVDLNQADDEPFEMTKEIETRVIGNLLPDDDDLFSSVLGDVGYNTQGNNQDDIEDDIFSTGGGMELEADGNNKQSKVNGGVSYSHTMSNDQLNGECTYVQQSSRTLFVGNIDSNIEDSELKFIFEVSLPFQLATPCGTF